MTYADIPAEPAVDVCLAAVFLAVFWPLLDYSGELLAAIVGVAYSPWVAGLVWVAAVTALIWYDGRRRVGA